MPTVSSGAVTMKMISSTSMTSTIGVTLISLIGATSGAAPAGSTATLLAVDLLPWLEPHAALVDLARQDGRELVGESLRDAAA